ncbi:MAG: FtsX-like permease family protein [Saprospiraceae bacterium]|nr:FtsX-like permease family protein [Saprospiraceae bacterium]
MNLTLDIARRYLLGKKSTNAINIITWVSILGLSIGSAALILILSVFNGFESVLTSLFDSFNPQIKVMPVSGKYFTMDEDTISMIEAMAEVSHVSRTIEETALIDYKGIQEVGIIKGVDEQYRYVTDIDSSLRSGKLILDDPSINYGILGSGMSTKLSINYNDAITPVTIYMPTRSNRGPLAKDYRTMDVYPSGIFSAGSDADLQYIVTNYERVNRLLELKEHISFLEIRLKDKVNEFKVIKAIADILGPDFLIKNRYEQDATYFKVMNTEKWVSFLITSFIMLIIAFNMIGSLWMLVLEKKQDLSILQAMGFTSRKISGLIMYEGMLIAVVGLVSGIILALILYFLQANYGIVGIPEGFLIDAYPIELKWWDFILVSVTVLSIGALASILPAFRAGKITPYVNMEA